MVGVKNEEPLFVCKSQSPAGPPPSPDSANITIKVIDVNDPPFYEKDSFDVYQREEEGPGQVLFTPKVLDSDSDVSKIRLVSTCRIMLRNYGVTQMTRLVVPKFL